MIQRVQSLYLLFPLLFYLVYWLFGLSWYEKGYKLIYSNSTFSNTDNLFLDILFFITSYIPLVIAIICLITVLMFKRRLIQIRLANISLLLSVVMSLYTIIYFFYTLQLLWSDMSSVVMKLLLCAAIINPFICSFLIFLAIKSIKKDEDLIKSIDRIR